jgi:hypothetical protein
MRKGQRIVVRAILRPEPDLGLFAEALLALARQELEAQKGQPEAPEVSS